MRWYYLLFTIPLFLLVSYRSEPPTATGSGWSRDSVNAWWEDSNDNYLSVSKIRDTATVVVNETTTVIRGNIADTSAIYAGDSVAVIRDRLVADTIDVDSTNTDHMVINTNVVIGAGGTITKVVKVNSHLAIILGTDTLWAAADTGNF